GNYFTHTTSRPRESAPRAGLNEHLRRSILAERYGYFHLAEGDGLPRAFVRALSLIPSLRSWASHQMGASMLPYQPGGKLLDVGCGNGGYLLRMRGYGWEVAGIEPDKAAARAGAREHGLVIDPGTTEDAPFAAASRDGGT